MSLSPARPRVVFDCNIYLQAMAFEDGPAAAAMRLAEEGAFELFISRPTMAELRRAVTYEEVRAISPNMTPVRITAFLDRLAYRANFHCQPHERPLSVLQAISSENSPPSDCESSRFSACTRQNGPVKRSSVANRTIKATSSKQQSNWSRFAGPEAMMSRANATPKD